VGAANKAFVLESRLAGWIAGNRADIRIWLDAPDGARRPYPRPRRDDLGDAGPRGDRRAALPVVLRIDLSDRSIYDLAINTGRWNTEATLDLALTAIEGYDDGVRRGAFDTPDFEI